MGGAHAETPLRWAASSDDVEVLDALVEAGADVEAPGSVIDVEVQHDWNQDVAARGDVQEFWDRRGGETPRPTCDSAVGFG